MGPDERRRVPAFELAAPSAPPPALLARVVGCVVGAAVGDALGAPFEFLPRGTFRSAIPVPLLEGTGEMVGGGAFGWAPGEFTDDTQMGLALAASLRARRGYDPDDVWERWRTWGRHAPDVGATTRHALAHPDWRDVAHPDPQRTAANGALMRAFPLVPATLHVDDPIARAVVLHQAWLTHAHPAAAWAAWLGVAAMRAAVRAEDPWAVLDAEVAALPADVGPRFAEMLAPGWHPDDADVGNGSAWGCLAQAVWAVRGAAGFEEAVTAAVDLGSDADTVACVTGALAGALHGIGAVPERWAAAVNGRLDAPGGAQPHDRMTLAAVGVGLVGRA
ncbi:MAG: ADP-ribosylglycohydrolase family protein [Nitriliruptoraceae bacterium]